MTAKAESQSELALLSRISELEAALAREERISAALREVGLALGTTLDLDQLLELILQKITEILEADRATLYLLDELNGELVSRITIGGTVRSIRTKVGHGIAGVVARTGKVLRVRDAYSDKRFARDWDQVTGYRTRSTLAAPMKNHLGRTIGVVQVLNKKLHGEFTTADENLLSALATQAAVSIDNSRLFLSVIQKNMQLLDTKEQLEHRVRDLKLLFELESAMGRATSEEGLLRGVLKEAIRASESKAGAVLLQEDSDTSVALFTLEGDKGAEIRRVPLAASVASPGFVGAAMQKNEPVLFDPATPLPASVTDPVEAMGFDITSAVAVPLDGPDDAPIGAIALYNKSENRAFAREDLQLLRLISANVSTAIELFRSRTAREREERLSTIGRLLSSVVHDLKTPMTIINGYVQMMSGTKEKKKRTEQAGLIRKQLDLIAVMQREVLEFARGEKRLLARRVYLAPFFDAMREQLEREVDGHKIKLSVELLDRGTARFDEGKMTRALHNLARNAIDAMGKKGGKLRIVISRDAKSKASPASRDLVISVSDTGPGIPKEIEGRIFTSFVTGGKKGGTGLGLAIVKKIVEEHGGTIGVASTRAGTTFTLVLPQSETPA